jgi:long-chain acyl-CoA synthetase
MPASDAPYLLHQLLERAEQAFGNKIALRSDGRTWTYSEIGQAVRRLALQLLEGGVTPGDRVVIYLDNSPQAIIAVFAACCAGGVFVLVNPRTPREKLAFYLRDTEAAAFLTQPNLLVAAAEAQSDCPGVRLRLVLGESDENNPPGWRKHDCFNAREQGASRTPMWPARIDLDLVCLVYTSGSSGTPKAVMLSHRNMLSALGSIQSYLQLRSDDYILCALPLSFDYGLYQILLAINVGARVALESSAAFPASLVRLIEEERITVAPGIPMLLAQFTKLLSGRSYDVASVRIVTNTGAALSEEVIRRVRRSFPAARLYSMYGLTECKRVSYLPPEELDRRPLSIGRGMPNQDHWLINDAGERLGPGQRGELVVRGSHVMLGYWRRPEETRRHLDETLAPGERVLRTGDIFSADEEGFLYFVGRKDSIIKSRGEKVSPREVENALLRLPGVAEAVVFGVADVLLGEGVAAQLRLDPGVAYTERQVIRHCLSLLEPACAPRVVQFVEDFPRTSNGKIDVPALRSACSATSPSAAPTLNCKAEH